MGFSGRVKKTYFYRHSTKLTVYKRAINRLDLNARAKLLVSPEGRSLGPWKLLIDFLLRLALFCSYLVHVNVFLDTRYKLAKMLNKFLKNRVVGNYSHLQLQINCFKEALMPILSVVSIYSMKWWKSDLKGFLF